MALGTPGCGGGHDDQEQALGTETAPLYALVSHVWTDSAPTGYVALLNDLDVDDLSLDAAREFPGYTSVGVAEGQLLVSPSADVLTIERYRIDDDFQWHRAGALGFTSNGAEAVGFFRQYMRRDGDAYLDVDITGRVIWNAKDFKVQGEGPETDLAAEVDGLDLFANLNRTYFVFDDEIFRLFSYHDPDWFRWSADTKIATYDPVTHEPRAILGAPCPGLDTITRDEAGNTYLATWEYSAFQPLMGTGAAPCVVRLTPDDEIDERWDPDLTDMTGGRQIVNFRYIGHGKAVAAVFHAEEFGKDYDFQKLGESIDDFWAVASRFHRLWLFDLSARSAAPLDGIDDFEFVNPGFFHAVIDDRVFLFLLDGSSDDYSTTAVYELERSGQAVRRFRVQGGVVQWVRIR